jgi:hypothetical protein
MKEQSIIEVGESRPRWGAGCLRAGGTRRLLQQLPEEEVGECVPPRVVIEDSHPAG